MATFDEESNNIVSRISKEFIDEQPKIGTAVKNLIAMVLGKATSCPSASLLFEGDHIFTPEVGLSCGRCLLQAIQRSVLTHFIINSILVKAAYYVNQIAVY